MKTVKLLFLIMLCFVLVTFTSNACASTITLSIPSTQPWTNTNIWLGPGDFIEIWASGTIVFADPDSANTTGPDGVAGTSSDERYVVTDPSIPQNSLIGNIALSTSFYDGAGFFVGSHFSGTVPISGARLTSGYLYLGHNDGAILAGRTGYDSWGFTGDNSGSWSVEINHISGNTVPEPMTFLLFGPALAGVGYLRRRRRTQK